MTLETQVSLAESDKVPFIIRQNVFRSINIRKIYLIVNRVMMKIVFYCFFQTIRNGFLRVSMVQRSKSKR